MNFFTKIIRRPEPVIRRGTTEVIKDYRELVHEIAMPSFTVIINLTRKFNVSVPFIKKYKRGDRVYFKNNEVVKSFDHIHVSDITQPVNNYVQLIVLL